MYLYYYFNHMHLVLYSYISRLFVSGQYTDLNEWIMWIGVLAALLSFRSMRERFGFLDFSRASVFSSADNSC